MPTSSVRAPGAALAAALLSVASGAAAQQTSPDTAALAPVVVTATRVDARLAAPTAAATVLTGAELRTRGITTVAEALREVPGAAVVRTGSVGSETGLFLRGGERDYVLVLVDGVPVNDPGGFIDLANLTTDNVERIEVVRGPVSVLYGSEAVTGVVQIFTRAGSERGRARLAGAVEAGSYGTRHAELTALGGSARTAWSLGGADHRTTGILPFNNDYRNSVASGRLTVTPDAATAVDLTARYGDARFEYPTEYYGAALDSNAMSTQRRLTVGLDARRRLSPRVETVLTLGSSRTSGAITDPADGPADFGYRVTSDSWRRGGDLRVNLRASERAVLTTGVDLDWQRAHTDGADSLYRRWSRAAYAQALGDLGGAVSYSAGVRLDDNERFGTFATYRLGAGLRLPAGARLRASWGTAFKEPQFLEQTGGGFARPNPALEPETSASWEVGAEQSLAGGRLALGATWFAQRFRDLIVYAPLDGDPEYTAEYRNESEADARGLEVEARAVLHRTLSARASMSWLEAVIAGDSPDAGDRLLRRPARQGALSLVWRPGSRVALTSGVTYVGPRQDVRFAPWPEPTVEVELPAHALVDVGGEWTVVGGRTGGSALALTARVSNLLDREHQAVAGFAAPGRIVTIGARFGLGR